jgi:hypothetical protein
MTLTAKLLGVAVATVASVALALKLPKGWMKGVAVIATLAIIGLLWKPQQPVMEMPECPHEWSDSTAEGWPSSGQLAIPGPITNVPEYHDCQRFLIPVGSELKYDSLQAIFVRHNLEGVYNDNSAIVVPAVPGSFLSVAAQDPTLGIATVVSSGSGRLVTIATIYSEGPYAPLGIFQRFQCVVLFWDGKTTNPLYIAWMVPVDSDTQCVNPRNLLYTSPSVSTRSTAAGVQARQLSSNLGYVNAFQLHVTLAQPSVGSATGAAASAAPTSNTPPVAKWDWDTTAKKHYIGMMCPTGYCELHGQPTYTASPTYRAPADLAGRLGTPMLVKGWYDEQLLASTKGWKQGIDGARGTLVPVPGLESRTVDSYKNTWLPAAWVTLDRASPGYKAKSNFGFSATDNNGNAIVGLAPAGSRTEVALCFSPTTGGACSGELPASCPVDTKNAGTWYGKVTSSSAGTQAVKYVCTVYRPAKDNSQPPGVVRWRWSVRDEIIWVSCPTGCCETEVDI